jgi:hypothetical protein
MSIKKSYRCPLICGLSVGVISTEIVRRFTLARVGKLHCLTNFTFKPRRSKSISGEVHLKNPRGQRLAMYQEAGKQTRAPSIWQLSRDLSTSS